MAKAIRMGYVASAYTALGSEIFIHIRNTKVKAVVTKIPFC
jgi:aminomethyltransferase